MRIPWTDKLRNGEVLKRAGAGHETNLRNKNKADEVSGTFDEKRWFGESGVDPKIEGRRSRGRKWSLWMANLNEWIRERGVKYQDVVLFEKARDRELWKSMIAHVIGYGTQRER